MKIAKLSLMFLACTAAFSASAQNATESRCGSTNYDRTNNMYTITNPAPNTATQQCFITVVSKNEWSGANPDLSTSMLPEGNYSITLSGGGGGGGGGAGGMHERNKIDAGLGGGGGHSAVPVTVTRYLKPGVYRLTIGAGGQGGAPGVGGERVASGGGHGGDGGPTGISETGTGQTIAGFPSAESWSGTYPLVALGYAGAQGPTAPSGATGGAKSTDRGEPGKIGGPGFIKMAYTDSVPKPAAVAPVQPAAEPAPLPPPVRPARRDRN